MDIVWAFLSSASTGDGYTFKFAHLSKVARFSKVHHHRSSLNLDGTLSTCSILIVKLHNPEPCYKFEPSTDMLKKSKKETRQYNREHAKEK